MQTWIFLLILSFLSICNSKIHNESSKKKKEIVSRNFFAFLNASYPKTLLMKSLNSLDSSRPYGRLLKNKKAGCSKELLLPKYNFQNSSTKIFPKKHSDFGGLETKRRHKIQTWFFCTHPILHMNSIQYKNCSGCLKGTSSKCHKFCCGQNF